MEDNRRTLEVPSRIRSIREVSSEILRGLSAYEIGDEGLFDIRLCVEEAVRNAIVHGNRSNEKLRVRVSYWVELGRLYIEVADEGSGFDHHNVADPTRGSNMLKESGRGVALMRELMDKVMYNDKGNKVLMEKAI